jgi:hypothetical protein
MSRTPTRIEVRTSPESSYAFSYKDEANARLIAASPDMLEALYAILNIEGSALYGAHEGLDVPWHFEKVRKAIQLAEGW